MRATQISTGAVLLLASVLACGEPRSPAGPAAVDPLAAVLASPAADPEIARWQQRVADDPGSAQALERLGWAFVARAQESEDPGYYALAEQGARALSRLDPDAGALLLARTLHGRHRFGEAEGVARSLLERSEGPFAWAVLGDALLDQGRIDEAASAYERMMALRPDSQALARFAELLFRRGELAAATRAMRLSARSVSPRSAHAHAWTRARLATFLLHAGELDPAEAVARDALRRAPDSVDALLVLGRVQLAHAAFGEAAGTLARAAARSSRPALLWALSEALRAAGREGLAREVEARLDAEGARSDPRDFAVYLASRRRRVDEALALARAELASRRDVASLTALAWCEHAAGNPEAAYELVRSVADRGARDPRLDLHAGVIAASVGAGAEARLRLARARSAAHLLLPSERARLAAAEASLSETDSG